MAKSKKSKILAMALCASVMTGIYASPVMAAGQVTGLKDSTNTVLTADDTVSINGVEFTVTGTGVDGTVKAAGGNFTQLTVTNGMEITGGVLTVGGTSIDSTTGNTKVGGTLTVGGLAQLQGGLKVTGNANLEKLNVNGKLTVDAISGVVADNLTVDTNAYVQGDLTVGNALTAGATNVSSLAVNTDKFTVDVYGNTTVGGELAAGSGNFTVDTDGNTTIIGADKQLTVEGTAQIGTMTATTAQVGGGLTVGGETTLAGLTAKGAADLQGGLTVSKGATVNGGLTVDTDRFVVDGVTGNTTVGGTLEVTGETTLKNTTVDGTLKAGDTTLANTTVDGTLNVTGATTVDSLTVKGAATVDSLEVAKGIEAANGTFKLTEEGKLTVNGEATFNDKVKVGGSLSVAGHLSATGGASVDGNFAVTNGNLSVTNGGLTVNNGDTTLNGKLDVDAGNFKVDTNGNTEFNGNLNINHGAFEVTAADGSFSAARDNFKVSADGVINADSLYLQTYGDGALEVGEALQALTDAKLPDKVGGIERDPAGAGDPGNGTTTIENGAEFTETAMTMGDTIVESGKITVGAADNHTVIEGGAITAKSLLLDGKDVGKTIFGIERDPENEVTTIEGATSFDATGMSIKDIDGFGTSLGVAGMKITTDGGLSTTFTAGGATFVGASGTGTTTINGGAIQTNTINGVDFSDWYGNVNDRLDVLEDKTQNIKPGTGEGGTAAGESNNIIEVPVTENGTTGINGNVTVGGEITAGAGNIGGIDMAGGTIETGDTTIDGDGITTGDITAGTGTFDDVIIGEKTTIDGDGIKTGNGNFTGNVDVDGIVTVGDGTTSTTITGDGITTGDINAGTGTIGNVDMNNTGITVGGGTTITEDIVKTENIKADGGEFDSQVTVGGNTTITDGKINLGGDNGTNINGSGMTVGEGTDIKDGNITVKGNEGKVEIGEGDVAIFDEIGEKVTSIQHNYDEINRVEEKFDGEVNRLDNRISKVEDRVDKVGAMSAAIANLRTMGYDPAAPTEIAVGVGQYRSETGVALGMFHYPNKDFMLSLSVSTSGDEVMGGIGATWKFGRKSPEKVLAAEKEKAAKAKLAKAEAMKKAAKEAKIKAQQERHAKLAAERAAQAEAAK